MRSAIIAALLLLWLAVWGVEAGTTTSTKSPTGSVPVLALAADNQSAYVKPGESVVLTMDVSGLPRKVNACQAMLGFDSHFLSAAAGCVQPGGGVWDQLIYNSWDVGTGLPGEIDTAIGLDAQGAVGTDADGTIARLTLTAGTNEGTTTVVFRPDGDDTHSTFLSDLQGLALYPDKLDSRTITIDGTPPVVSLIQPNGGESLLGGRIYEVKWSASDLNLGSGCVTIDYSPDGGANWFTAAAGEDNDGVYEWLVPPTLETDNALVRVTVVDLADNGASDQSDAPFRVRAMNRLALDVQEPSLFVQPGANVLIDLNVTNLGQKVNACQAMLGFDSHCLSASGGCVQPGGGVWDQLIYNSWDVGTGLPGEIDTAIGLDAQGAVGTDEDGTIAKLTLTAGANEGVTTVVFRPDEDDTHSTFLSDLAGGAVWPYKVDSLQIVIDGTPPLVTVLQPNGGEMLVGGHSYEITWTASDAHLGPTPITIEFSSDGGAHWTPVASDQANDGSYWWTVPYVDTTSARIRVTARDRAGNQRSDVSDGDFSIDSSGPSLSIATAKQAVCEGPFNAAGLTYTKVVDGGARVISGACFSPSGGQIAYIERTDAGLSATYYIKLLDRASGITTVLAQSSRNGSGTSGFEAYYTPYFSADGTRVGWTKGFLDTCNQLETFDLRNGTIKTYRPPNMYPPPDSANSDFYGSCTDQWVAWDWNSLTFQSDLKLYGPLYNAPYWYWQVTSVLTNTTDLAEYEPDSDRAGGRILYCSGGTPSEDIYRVHVLKWNGSAWVRDLGFTPIQGATWPYWSADETEIGLSKYDLPPGTGRADLYVYDSGGNFRFDLTGTAVPQYRYSQTFGFNCAVGPQGAGREYLFLSNAGNTQGGRDVWVARITPELLYSARPAPVSAVQGDVYIDVAVSDSVSGVGGPPAVTVADAAGVSIPVTYVGVVPGFHRYKLTITPDTANGQATVRASATDVVGHITNDIDYFDVFKNRVAGTVSFDTLSTESYWLYRDVTFKATGAAGNVLKMWTTSVRFENQPSELVAVGHYSLDDLPAGAVNLSAKTGCSLRDRQAMWPDGSGQAVVDLVLPGGDMDGSNTVTTSDYSALKAKWLTTNGVVDINGDGQVQLLDYSLMRASWYTVGDPE